MNTEHDYYLAWSACPQIGPIRFSHLLKIFGSAKAAWEAADSDLQAAGAGGRWLKEFLYHRKKFDFSQLKLKLKEWGITWITIQDEEYPKQLKEIDKAPFGLYVMGKGFQGSDASFRPSDEERGEEEKSQAKLRHEKTQTAIKISPLGIPNRHAQGRNDSTPLLAVVGTRKMTTYGQQVTRLLTQGLVDAGFGIISGLMYGVDETAHRACIDAGGYTVGVWAGGLDTLFNGSRKNLVETILDSGGTLISEFPIGLQPSAQTFPYRNRIVAGISCGVLVTEGSDKSGTLITAGYAAEQGKEVFAVPGPITSQQSAAPSKLIKSGAKLVTSVQDILEELDLNIIGAAIRRDLANTQGLSLNKTESQIFDLLENEPLSLDQLSRRLKLPASELGSTLSLMELKGWVSQNGGQWVIKQNLPHQL
jgi:DNA processing protein